MIDLVVVAAMLLAALGLSTLARSLAVLYNVVLLCAFKSGMTVPLSAGLVLLVTTNLGSAVPSAPGYVGVVHYLVALTLCLWSVQRESAMAYSLVWHGIWYVSMLVMGPVGLIYEGISLGRVRQLVTAIERRAEG